MNFNFLYYSTKKLEDTERERERERERVGKTSTSKYVQLKSLSN
jgi:hypothetical protein